MKFVSYITLAPEQVSKDIICDLVSRGIKVSLGHTQCNYKQAVTSFEMGASCVTHMFSCIRPFHHRDPGIIGAITSDAGIYWHVSAKKSLSHAFSGVGCLISLNIRIHG